MKYFDEETHLELMMKAPEGHVLIGYLPNYTIPVGINVNPLFSYKGNMVLPVYRNDDAPEYRALIDGFLFAKITKEKGSDLTFIIIPDYWAIQCFRSKTDSDDILMFFNKWGYPLSSKKNFPQRCGYAVIHLYSRLVHFLIGKRQ